MTNMNQETQRETGNEITLVELATTFIRRRRVFYVTFLLITVLALGYIVMTPAKYEFVTLVQLAKDGKGVYVEQPGVIVNTLENRWIPEQVASFMRGHNSSVPFTVTAVNPSDTGLIRLTSVATEQQGELVSEIHASLVAEVKERQEQMTAMLRNNLDKHIASQSKVVDALKSMGGGENAALALASAIQKRAELENEKKSFLPGEVLVVSRQSNSRMGPGKFLVLALGLILALIGAVFMAFFAEFVSQVRKSLSNERPG